MLRIKAEITKRSGAEAEQAEVRQRPRKGQGAHPGIDGQGENEQIVPDGLGGGSQEQQTNRGPQHAGAGRQIPSERGQTGPPAPVPAKPGAAEEDQGRRREGVDAHVLTEQGSGPRRQARGYQSELSRGLEVGARQRHAISASSTAGAIG